MLPRENKGKGCVVQRVNMPPLTKEVRELRWQTGSEALQLLLCVLLQFAQVGEQGDHCCKPSVRSAREICPWLTNTTCVSLL